MLAVSQSPADKVAWGLVWLHGKLLHYTQCQVIIWGEHEGAMRRQPLPQHPTDHAPSQSPVNSLFVCPIWFSSPLICILLAIPSVEFLASFGSMSPKLLLYFPPQFLYPDVLKNLKKEAVNIMLGILKHTMSSLSLPSVVPRALL